MKALKNNPRAQLTAASVPEPIQPLFLRAQQLEDALRLSEARFRAIFDGAGVGIAVVGMDRRILEANQQLQRMLGYSADELRRFSTPAEFTHPDDCEADRPLHDQLFSGKLDYYEREKRYLRKDGSPVWARVKVSLGRRATGEPEFVIAMVEDITQTRATADALRRSERLASAGRLAATVAHEINNPLEAVTNLLYLARQQEGLPDNARELLDLADRELERVTQIARQTLGFYRGDAAPSSLRIADVLQDVLTVYTARAAAKQVRLEARLDDPGEVRGQRGELQQLFSNLLANAIDATPSGGHIRFRVRTAQRQGRPGVSVVIADSGAGIPPELRARIFEPFFTTKQEAGTGLGLWLAREIVAKHAGAIRVRSSVPPARSGSVFEVFLPQA